MSKSIQKEKQLIGDIQKLIEESRKHVAVEVNSTITILYWQIGKRIIKEVLKEKRIVVSLIGQLSGTHIKTIILKTVENPFSTDKGKCVSVLLSTI